MSQGGIHGTGPRLGKGCHQSSELTFPCHLAAQEVWIWREQKVARDWLTMTFRGTESELSLDVSKFQACALGLLCTKIGGSHHASPRAI